MADSDLGEAVLGALNHYNDLEALQVSPLGKLDALWPLRPLAAEELLASLAIGLAVRRLLDRAIERLRETWTEAAELLHQCFRLEVSVKDISERQSLTTSAIYHQRKKAIVALTTIIAAMVAEAAESRQDKVYDQLEGLPALYRTQQVVGFEEELAQMRAILRASLIQPSLLVITGLGGIGKTSLLSFALRSWLTQEAPPILRVLWAVLRVGEAEALGEEAAEQAMGLLLGQLGKQLELSLEGLSNHEERLQAIAKHLLACRQRFVIVLDDVKSKAEADLALKVALSLLPLAQIVITSDRNISHNQVHRFGLGELSEAHALELLRLEAKRHGYEPLSDDEAQQLYQEVGGHPLALKLIAEQVSRMPIELVLSALHRPSPLADELYTHVYEPSWALFSDLSRKALLSLQRLPPEGADWQALHDITSICDDSTLEQVVNDLTTLNLLQVTISATRQYTYALHRLTYRFLEHQSRMMRRKNELMMREG